MFFSRRRAPLACVPRRGYYILSLSLKSERKGGEERGAEGAGWGEEVAEVPRAKICGLSVLMVDVHDRAGGPEVCGF